MVETFTTAYGIFKPLARDMSDMYWARQMIAQVRKWLPERDIVVVGDTIYAALELPDGCSKLSKPVILITRLRLDAALYAFPPKEKSPKNGRPRKKGDRLPNRRKKRPDRRVEPGSERISM